MLESDLEVRRQSLEIVRQQLHGKILRCRHRRPDHAVRFVGADQGAAALLAHVDRAGVVSSVDDLAIAAAQLRQVLGDQVVVLHRQHRQLDADHVADLPRPQPGAVDDVLGVQRALVGHDVPGAVRALRERLHARETLHRCAQLASCLDVGLRGPGRIAMAAVGAPQRSDEIAWIDQRIELERLLERDHLGFHAEVARPRADQPETIELPLVRRQHQAAVRVQAARLPRERLDLAVQVDGVLLQPRDVGLAVEGMHAAGRMPGRAGGQFALLDQQYVVPADLRQVIEHAGADHAATDDDRLRGSLHEPETSDDAISPKGWAVATSHSRRCRAVLAGVSSSTPAASATRITGT